MLSYQVINVKDFTKVLTKSDFEPSLKESFIKDEPTEYHEKFLTISNKFNASLNAIKQSDNISELMVPRIHINSDTIKNETNLDLLYYVANNIK